MLKTSTLMLAGLLPALALAQEKQEPKSANRVETVLTERDASLEAAKVAEARAKEAALRQQLVAEQAQLVAEKERARAEAALEAAREQQKLAEQQRAQAEELAIQARNALQRELEARQQAEAAKKQAEVALEKAKADASAQEPKKQGRRGRRQNRTAELEKQVQTLAKQVQQLQMEVNGLKAMIQKTQAAGKPADDSAGRRLIQQRGELQLKSAPEIRLRIHREADENSRREQDARQRAEDAFRKAEAALQRALELEAEKDNVKENLQKLLDQEKERVRALEEKLRKEGLKRFDEFKESAGKIEIELELEDLGKRIEQQAKKEVGALKTQLETLPQKKLELENLRQKIQETIEKERAALERELQTLPRQKYQLEDIRKQIEKTLEKEAVIEWEIKKPPAKGEAAGIPELEIHREAKASDAEARYVFNALDRNKDGELTSDEWSRSKSVREGFEKNGIKLQTPAGIQSFLNQYPRHRVVPQLRLPDAQ